MPLSRARRPGRLLTALATVGTVGAVGALAGCGDGTGHATRSAGTAQAAGTARAASAAGAAQSAGAATPVTVTVSLSGCGGGWTAGRAGPQAFTLRDTDTRAAEVTLVNPASGAVFAEVEPIAAGRSAPLTVTLAGGRYAFRCAMEDEDVVTGPAVPVSGPAQVSGAAAGVLPVSLQDLIGPARHYTAYVRGRLPALTRQVTRLERDVAAGDRARARRDWLAAHLTYLRLGAAYGAFGDLDGDINALPPGGPAGVHDPGFAGFHRVEFALWHGAHGPALRRPVAALVRAVRGLPAQLASTQLDPGDLSIRAHEISENALQFTLTGRDDLGSHSAVATLGADLDATLVVLGEMRPVLAPRYPALAATVSAVRAARAQVRHLDPSRRPLALTALSRPDRERLDALIADLAERLSAVAAIAEPRRLT